jgi:hypothetical protein
MGTAVSDQHDPDEPIVGELRTFFARVDPVPPLVTQAAKAALTWRRVDAELAELLADSTLEAESLALARGSGMPVRSVSFSAGELTIDIEIHADDSRSTLLGQLSPPSIARIEIQTTGGDATVETKSDRLGRFRTQLPSGDTVRLRVEAQEPDWAPGIETSWFTI